MIIQDDAHWLEVLREENAALREELNDLKSVHQLLEESEEENLPLLDLWASVLRYLNSHERKLSCEAFDYEDMKKRAERLE